MLTYGDTINLGDVIAVGDVHARYDLLELLLDKLQDTQATVIFLGDIIDRGGQDIQVVERIRKLTEDPESEGLSNCFCLLGNHEDMFIDAVAGSGDDWGTWLYNGGNFEHYGELQEHLDWFEELPVYMTVGKTLFIHAGTWPGRDPFDTIDSGHAHSILWMRSPFLEFGPKFEEWNPDLTKVIFGHTPEGSKPYEIPQGICIDTGAFHTGVLTAYNVTTDTYFQVKNEKTAFD